MNTTYIYVTDDDGHQYYIPKSEEKNFDRLVYDEDNSGLECWERDEWEFFENSRCEDDPNDALAFFQEKYYGLADGVVDYLEKRDNETLSGLMSLVKDYRK